MHQTKKGNQWFFGMKAHIAWAPAAAWCTVTTTEPKSRICGQDQQKVYLFARTSAFTFIFSQSNVSACTYFRALAGRPGNSSILDSLGFCPAEAPEINDQVLVTKLFTRTIFAIAGLATAFLTGCGGGGSSSNPAAETSQIPATPAARDLPGITVTSMIAPNYSSADCPRFLSTRDSEAALDLSNATIKAISDFLATVDPDARAVFVRRPYDFVNWIARLEGKVDLVAAGTATHETIHQVSSVLRGCDPLNTYKILFKQEVLVTGVVPGDTPSMKIVADHIDPALKSEPRYKTYITDAVPGNDMSIVLDEFGAYASAAHTELQMLVSGQTGGFTGSLDGDLGGTVNLMVYLQTYLKALRLDNPVAYETIKKSPRTIAAIQAIWNSAEQTLRDSYGYVKGGTLRVNTAYMEAAYSADLLGELDSIGVTHVTQRSWSGTYLP